MTEAKKREREEWERNRAIVAHSVAEQITAIPTITFQGALDTVGMVKEIIERDMKRRRAYTSPEIRDTWGTVIEAAGEGAPAG